MTVFDGSDGSARQLATYSPSARTILYRGARRCKQPPQSRMAALVYHSFGARRPDPSAPTSGSLARHGARSVAT